MDNLATVNDYSYLAEYSGVKFNPSEIKFHKVSFGGTNTKTDPATGEILDTNKFNAGNFPGLNYSTLKVMPLQFYNQHRMYYAESFKAGVAKPPSCFSDDGIEPTVVGKEVNGITVFKCAECPFNPFEADACKPYPLMYGVAIFNLSDDGNPNANVYAPIYIAAPPISKGAVTELPDQFIKPVQVNGDWQVLPPFTRIVNVGIGVNANNRMIYKMSLSKDTFAPKDLLDNISVLTEAVKAHRLELQRMSSGVPKADATVNATPYDVVDDEELPL